jgi:hypothetical protein
MASLSPPNPAGGDALNAEPHAKAARGSGDRARAEELSNLRLALATFALQLDIFETRLRDGRRGAGKALEILEPPTHKDRGTQKEENGWASIKSHGSRSGT